jgi:hypothetical protein
MSGVLMMKTFSSLLLHFLCHYAEECQEKKTQLLWGASFSIVAELQKKWSEQTK